MQEYAKHFARRMLLIYFLRSTYKKYIFLYPETGPRNRPKLKKKTVYEEVSFLLRTNISHE